MIEAHGGQLIDRTVEPEEGKEMVERAAREVWPVWEVTRADAARIEGIATGVYSPLEGFAGPKDFESVLQRGRLSDGTPWTIPLIFPISDQQYREWRSDSKASSAGAESVMLSLNDEPFARLSVEAIYPFDKAGYAAGVFSTQDPDHPGVRRLDTFGDNLVAGTIDLITPLATSFDGLKQTPSDTRRHFQQKGWESVVGFQTRNVPHLGHEYVQKTALTLVDGIFLNPVLGPKKPGDFRDEVIVDAYRTLLTHYFPDDYAAMSVLEYDMQYAGPREAVHHAIMRKNFGCTHFVVGRDHAGVADYYGRYEAQAFFDSYPDLGIKPVPFKSFYFCNRCGSVVNAKICPHPDADHRNFSGTRIRRILQGAVNGDIERQAAVDDLKDMMRSEVVEAVLEHGRLFHGM